MSDPSQNKKKSNNSNSSDSRKKGSKNVPEQKKPWSILFWLLLALIFLYALPLNNDEFSDAETLSLKTLRSDLIDYNVERVILKSGKISWKISKDGLPEDRNELNTTELIIDLNYIS